MTIFGILNFNFETFLVVAERSDLSEWHIPTRRGLSRLGENEKLSLKFFVHLLCYILRINQILTRFVNKYKDT